MPVQCPKCGSRNLRFARIRLLKERVRSWFGVRPLRCRDCRQRFIDRTWRMSSIKFARCPKCWRMDLNFWSTKDYHESASTRFWLSLGAKPYRCEYCRCNFASFRPRLEKFTFKRWKRHQQAEGGAGDLGANQGTTLEGSEQRQAPART